jgi:hypothetical protein
MAIKSYVSRVFSRGAAFGLQAGVLVWIIMLLQQSAAAHSDGFGVIRHVTFGPLVLMSLGKHEVEDHFVANFRFESGFLPYFAGWLVTGIIIAFVARWLLTRGLPPLAKTDVE